MILCKKNNIFNPSEFKIKQKNLLTLVKEFFWRPPENFPHSGEGFSGGHLKTLKFSHNCEGNIPGGLQKIYF